MNTSLPPGWVRSFLGEVARVNPRNFTIQPADNTLVTFVPMASVEAGSGRFDFSLEREWREVKTGFSRFEEGDVLFAKITPCMENGKFAIAKNLAAHRGAGSTEFHVLRPYQGIEPKYLLYFLLQESFRREARASMQGAAGQLRVPVKFLVDSAIPLPPAAEQLRIVAEIEKLLTRLDAAVTLLGRIQANLRRYRASVLATACEGRLVPTAAELARAEGREYKAATPYSLPEMKSVRSRSDLPDLPSGWSWSHVGDLAITKRSSICAGPFGTIFKAYDFRPKGIPIIFLRHVKPGEFLTRKPTYMDEEKWRTLFQPYSVYGGELLVTKLGEPPGACAIYPPGRGPAMLTPDVMKIEVDEEKMSARFLMHYFNSSAASRFSFGAAFGTTRLRLTIPIFRNLPVPLPPRQEQDRIVAEIERRFSIVEVLEKTVSEGLERIDRLRTSILKHAFEGKLVPQDPADEPASILLDRIRKVIEEDAEAAPKRGRKRQPIAPKTAVEEVCRPVGAEDSGVGAVPGAHAPGSILPPLRGSEEDREVDGSEGVVRDFVVLSQGEQVDLAWTALFGRGVLEKDEAVRTVAEALREEGLARFQRLRGGGPLYEAIRKALEAGVRDGDFDRPRRGYLRAVLRNPRDYEPETWRQCLLGSLDGEILEQDEALRAAAEWARETMGLEFARLREDGLILTGLREALGEAVRQGEVERVGRRQIRRLD